MQIGSRQTVTPDPLDCQTRRPLRRSQKRESPMTKAKKVDHRARRRRQHLEVMLLRGLFVRDAAVQRQRLRRDERLSRSALAPELREVAA